MNTGSTFVGSNDGEFQQNGGVFETGFLAIRYGSSYTMRGGQLSTLDSVYAGGTFDFGVNAAAVSVAGIANFSGATIVGGQQTSFSVGPDSLAIFPAGFDPAIEFGSFSNNGLVTNLGSDIEISAGRIVKGNGTIVDHVYCAGSLLQEAAFAIPRLSFISSNSINLKKGITVDGGVVQLGAASTLIVNDQISGITDGQLETSTMQVADKSGTGQFTQSGGAVTAYSLTVASSTGNSRVSGGYEISGGSLSVLGNLTLGATQGDGTVRQTGGQVDVGGNLIIGTGGHGGPPLGTYQIAAGTLTAANITGGGTYATGTLEVFGSATQFTLVTSHCLTARELATVSCFPTWTNPA